jgi:acetoin utilization deacetylase AcuC-like enzyme
MATRVIVDEAFEEHVPGPMHPESPGRIRGLRAHLQKHPVEGVLFGAPRPVTHEEVLRAHSVAHVEALLRLSGRSAQLDPDTAVSPRSIEVAWLAAGASVDLVHAVWRRETANGFALVRPPGHHAERDRAMGFCLLNNVSVAAEAAVSLGAQRVLILDWDVHHGNGTQSIFFERRDVLYVSLHQFPFYPGTGDVTETGAGAGQGFTVNAPLPPGQTDADYGIVFDELVIPLALAYRPELVLVSAGFDAHANDPLGHMRVTERGFAAMCTAARDIATSCSHGRLALFLEGGYALEALASSVHACLEVLAGQRRETFPSGGSREAKALADRVWGRLTAAAPDFWRQPARVR